MSAVGSNAPPSELELLARQLEELTDAHVEISDQMLALYKLTEFSAASLDADTTTERMVAQAGVLLDAHWVAFLRRDAEGALVPVADAVGQAGLRAEEGPVLADAAIRLGDGSEPYVVADELTGRSLLGVPVDADGYHVGMVVAASGLGRQFVTTDVKLAQAIANQLALLLHLADLHHDAVQRTLARRDHDIASQVAQAALKRPLPPVEGLDLAPFNRPARAAGGDFYAVAASDRGLYLALGDVSGKGLPAALIMSTAVAATYSAFERCPGGDTAGVLAEIDHQMWSHLTETNMFITLVVAHVDPTAHELHISNAGHAPVLVGRPDALVDCPADGPPIGVLEDGVHRSSHHRFGPGDLFFVGSDGWTDQTDEAGQMFGDDRLLAELGGDAPTAGHLVDRLVTVLDRFAQDGEQKDDLTALVLKGAEGHA
ncbi:MAG: GAF domain-containing SpoIIE family protein phosphatase [Actinomycetota bacterium]